MESVACGTSVVAFDCPGSLAEVFDDPSQGVLVPAGDVEALVRAIDYWLENQKYISKHCLLPKKFEVSSVTAQYKDLLNG